jgi:carbamoyltransferase
MILGISAGFHDAAATVINSYGDILFAGHSERYSKIKNDENFCQGLLNDILPYSPNIFAYYEKPWKKQLRRVYSGEGINWTALTVKQILQQQLGSCIQPKNIYNFDHHLSHAAAGFQTSPYERATVVVIDAIGELDTISIYGAEYDSKGYAHYKKLWSQHYPHSIGLFYSAMTQYVGLKPNEDEYILMCMSAYGKHCNDNVLQDLLINDDFRIKFKQNLHRGFRSDILKDFSQLDVATISQLLLEKLIGSVMQRAKKINYSTNLVYMGGVALNCLANRNLGKYFENIWIMPNPGDAGSSLGAAALTFGRKVNWKDAYLGHNISGPYPVDALLNSLLSDGIVGVANGRSEFGPRAFGNRSLLADPRGVDIKHKVNAIKQRQQFRPFAPVILEELADQFFDIPKGLHNHRYMQSVATCKHPDLYPAITHVDGTSRVQTVPKDGSGIRQLLEKWYQVTNCPMLLNTSLNIKGEPMVNDIEDAKRFALIHQVKVYC